MFSLVRRRVSGTCGRLISRDRSPLQRSRGQRRLAVAKLLRRLFPTRRRQIRGRCGRGTAAAGSAQRAVRLDVQERPVGDRWRGSDFRLRRTRTPPLTAVGRCVPRQRLQWYPVDPYRLPIRLAVCEGKRFHSDLNAFVKHLT